MGTTEGAVVGVNSELLAGRPRGVLRLWSPWSPVLVFGLGALGIAGILSQTLPLIVVGLAMIGLSFRAALAGVVARREHLLVRKLLRTRRVAAQDLVDVSAQMIDQKILPVWAPVVHNRGAGKEIPIRGLAGYSTQFEVPNRRVERVVNRLRSFYMRET